MIVRPDAHDLLVPATFGQRLGAFLLDALLAVAPYFGLLLLLPLLATLSPVAAFLSLAFLPLVAWLPNLVYRLVCDGGGGRSVGRAAVGIRLVRLDAGTAARRVGVGRAFGRLVVSGFGNMLLFANGLSVLWDPQRRSWGDRAAGTAVVQSRSGEGPRAGLVWGAVSTVGALGLVLLLGSWAGRSVNSSLASVGTSVGTSSYSGSYSASPTPTRPAGRDLSRSMTRTWTVSGAVSGAPVQVEVQTGDPVPYHQGDSNGRAYVGDGCQGSAADAVIPLTVNLSSTNASGPFGFTLGGLGGTSLPNFPGATLQADIAYAEGTSCSGGKETLAMVQQQVGPTGSEGFLFLRGFYSSTSTSRQKAMLADARLTIASSQSGSSYNLLVRGVQGPGVVQTGSGWSFALDGSSASPSPSPAPSASAGLIAARVTPGHDLHRRMRPDPATADLGILTGGTAVQVACQTTGVAAEGSSIWYRLDDGAYVYGMYIDGAGGAPTC